MATLKHFLRVGGLAAGILAGCNREAENAGNAEKSGNQAQAASQDAEKQASEARRETRRALSAGVNRSLDSLGESINRTWKKVTVKDRQAAAPDNGEKPGY